jgi:hypothetical protein
VARMGENRGAYRALVGKPEGGRQFGRLRRRWENNIKMDLTDWDGRACGLDRSLSELGQETGCCECGNECSGSIKCGEFRD